MRVNSPKKHSENTLEEYRNIINLSEDIITYIDSDYVYHLVNQKFLDVNQLTLKDVIGKKVPEVMGEELFTKTMKPYVDECLSGKANEYEMKRSYPGIGDRWLKVSYFPVINAEGHVTNLIAHIKDITQIKKAQQKLQEIEELYRTLAENSHDAVYIYRNNKLLFVNDTFCNLLGYTKEELLSIDPWNLVHPEMLEQLRDYSQKRLAGEKVPSSYEIKALKKDGTTIYLEVTISLILYKGKAAIFVSGRDITHYKSIENDLRDRIYQLDILNRNIPNVVWKADIEDGLTFTNTYIDGNIDDFLALPEGTIKNDWARYFSHIKPAYLEDVQKAFQKAIHDSEAEMSCEYEVNKADGTTAWLLSSGKVLQMDGKLQVYGNTIDITSRKNRENELIETSQMLHSTLESTNNGILVVSDEGRILALNEKFLQMWGINKTPEDFTGHDDKELLEQAHVRLEDPEKFLKKVKKLYNNPYAKSFDELHFKDGRIIERYSQPLLLKDKTRGRVWSFRDITKLRQAMESLQESEQRYKLLFDTPEILISVFERDGICQMINQKGAEMFNLKPEDVTGLSYEQLHPGQGHSYIQILRQVIDSGVPQEFEHEIQCLEQTYYFLTQAQPIPDTEGNFTLAQVISINITERKKAEEELRRREAFLSTIIDNIPDQIFIKDATNLRFIRTNKALEKTIGCSGRELINKTDYDIFPDQQAKLFRIEDKRILQNNKILSIPEEKVQTPEGMRVFNTKKIPIMDETGKPAYLLGISRDITELKQTENILLQSKVAAEEANRTKSNFLANMSHELRTPMNSIIGFSQILKNEEGGELTEKQDRYVSNVLKSANHLLKIINDILDISKIESGNMELEPEKANIEMIIHETIALMNPLAKKGKIILSHKVEPGDIEACVDRTKFKEIMYNLLSNAIKFTPENGEVSINAILNNDLLEVSVSDTGIGIDREKFNSIFDPFKQVSAFSNRKYEGTGLGLALVRNYVEMHGGRIRVESEVEVGSTFTFSIPIKNKI